MIEFNKSRIVHPVITNESEKSFKIEELENQIKKLTEMVNSQEREIKELRRIQSIHKHSGQDKSERVDGSLNLKPSSQLQIGTSAYGNTASNPGTASEVDFLSMVAGNDASGGTSAYTSGNAQINLQHAVANNGSTFYYGFTPPLYQNVSQSITNGGTTLQDGYFNWTTDELAGCYINILSAAGFHETQTIASNTADTITISGTWTSATGSAYSYTVWRPIYFGAAEFPWRRVYITDDIRIGTGTSSGPDVIYIKYGSGTPESAVTANVGSIYLRTDGGSSTTLYVKESGTGNTGWVAK